MNKRPQRPSKKYQKLTCVAALPLDPKQQGRSSKLTDVENPDYKETHTYK
jgi:hypothetical protein